MLNRDACSVCVIEEGMVAMFMCTWQNIVSIWRLTLQMLNCPIAKIPRYMVVQNKDMLLSFRLVREKVTSSCTKLCISMTLLAVFVYTLSNNSTDMDDTAALTLYCLEPERLVSSENT